MAVPGIPRSLLAVVAQLSPAPLLGPFSVPLLAAVLVASLPVPILLLLLLDIPLMASVFPRACRRCCQRHRWRLKFWFCWRLRGRR